MCCWEYSKGWWSISATGLRKQESSHKKWSYLGAQNKPQVGSLTNCRCETGVLGRKHSSPWRARPRDSTRVVVSENVVYHGIIATKPKPDVYGSEIWIVIVIPCLHWAYSGIYAVRHCLQTSFLPNKPLIGLFAVHSNFIKSRKGKLEKTTGPLLNIQQGFSQIWPTCFDRCWAIVLMQSLVNDFKLGFYHHRLGYESFKFTVTMFSG